MVTLFTHLVGIRVTHVPFKGTGPALAAVIAGHVQLIFGDAASATPQAEAGQLRALAVTAATRSPKLPSVPTVREAGVAGYDVAAWHGFFAPAGTPSEIIAKINAEVVAITREPAVRQRLEQDGIEVVGSTPEAFAAYLRSEVARWGTVARAAGIKLK